MALAMSIDISSQPGYEAVLDECYGEVPVRMDHTRFEIESGTK